MSTRTRTTQVIVALAALTLGATSVSAQAAKTQAKTATKHAATATKHVGKETQAHLKAEAKITEADAKKIALAKVPGGHVKSSELERENGKLLYSFDIATKGKTGIDEVQVDAITGQLIGDVVHETPKMEKAEAKAEAKEKKASAKEVKKP
jgi:uncharacterized membrane protein YkoI